MYNSHPINNFPRCPFEKVFSFIYRNTIPENRKKTKLLEIGCGACNNLFLAALDGFQCYGLDISEQALAFGKKRINEFHKDVNLVCGSFTDTFPWENGYFDLAFERGALSYVPFDQAKKTIAEVHRILTNNGKFLSGLYANDHEIYIENPHDKNGWVEFPEGEKTMSGYSSACFYSLEMVDALFPKEKWEIDKIFHVADQCITSGKETRVASYYVEVTKKED